MTWLELRTKDTVYNDGWNIKQSVWSPSLKKDGKRWPHWNLVEQVVKNDIIFHVFKIDGRNKFIGYSTADTDAYVSSEIPLHSAHDWSYSRTFNKVDLKNFVPFDPVIDVTEFLHDNHEVLLQHFYDRGDNKLFYTMQKARLQCFFGGYFSHFTETLQHLLVNDYEHERSVVTNVAGNVVTGVAPAEVGRRLGHDRFSNNVKNNFNNQCCYPGCNVEGRAFLVAGHIARWADNHELRGATSNGLCLCLMHDKAFEKGYFTFDWEWRVNILNNEYHGTTFLSQLLLPGVGMRIKDCTIYPSLEALQHHWVRIGFNSLDL